MARIREENEELGNQNEERITKLNIEHSTLNVEHRIEEILNAEKERCVGHRGTMQNRKVEKCYR